MALYPIQAPDSIVRAKGSGWREIETAERRAQSLANRTGNTVEVRYRKEYTTARGILKHHWAYLSTVYPNKSNPSRSRRASSSTSILTITAPSSSPSDVKAALDAAKVVANKTKKMVKVVAKRNPRRVRNESISQGFYAGGIFHPIRGADDYDAEAVGERYQYAPKRKAKKRATRKATKRRKR